MQTIHRPQACAAPRTELRAERHRQGLAREELAHRCGLSAGTIYRVEQGRQAPTRGTRRLLAIALGVPVEQLFPENSEAPATTGAPRQVAGRGDHAAG